MDIHFILFARTIRADKKKIAAQDCSCLTINSEAHTVGLPNQTVCADSIDGAFKSSLFQPYQINCLKQNPTLHIAAFCFSVEVSLIHASYSDLHTA